MSHFNVARPRPQLFVIPIAASAVVFAWGCGQREEIRSYTVAKEPKAEPIAATAPAEVGDPTHRMLAAIVPAGEQAWFFKVVGPLATVDKHADAVVDFFSKLRVADGERVRWELPADWKEDPPSQMRAATLWIPADGKPLELSVTTLSWRGTQEELLNNVNRWRGQMQLPAIGREGLASDTRELQAGDAKITVVDLRGRFQAGGMMAPFAGGGPRPGAMPLADNVSTDIDAGVPPGHPPLDAIGDAANDASRAIPLAADAPTFDMPASWEQLPVQPGGMRKAAFGVADGEHQALVTVIAFGAREGPMIADPLLNVNRWRREVGLSEIQNDELESATSPIEVDGKPGRYVKLIPDAEKPDQSQSKLGTLAVMVTHGGRIWFIKMQGNRELVAAQEDQFKSFLKSIRLPADGGANNGN